MTKISGARRVLIAGVSAMTLSACTYLPFEGEYHSKSMTQILSQNETTGQVRASLNYAIEEAHEMTSRASNSSVMQSVLYGLAIPTTAVAAYHGITGNRGPDAMATLTLSATTLFGVASLNQATPRQQVYLAGAQALSCVIWSSAPLAMDADTYHNLKANLMKLSEATPGATAALGRLKATVANLEASMANNAWKEDADSIKAAEIVLSSARASIAEGETLVGSAQKTEADAYKLIGAIKLAPQHILAQTKQISAAVNLQLAKAQPTPEAVLAVATRIRSGADTLTAALAPPKTAAGGNKEGQSAIESNGLAGTSKAKERERLIYAVREATQDLLEDLPHLAPKVSAVKVLADPSVEALSAATKIEACKPVGPTVAEFAVAPAPGADPIAIAPEGTINLTLTGGSGIYTAVAGGPSADSVTITHPLQSPVAGSLPIVTVKKGAAAGNFYVYLTDHSQPPSTKTLAFTIKTPAAAPAPANAGGSTPVKPPEQKPGEKQGNVAIDADPALSIPYTTKQITIIQLAALNSANLDSTAFTPAKDADGDWGMRTDAIVNTYLFYEAGYPSSGSRADLLEQLHAYLAGPLNREAFFAAADRTLGKMKAADRRSLYGDNEPLEDCLGRTLAACW